MDCTMGPLLTQDAAKAILALLHPQQEAGKDD